MPIVDRAGKLAMEWSSAERAVMVVALEAREEGRQTLKAQGAEPEEVIVHYDQDTMFNRYARASHLLLGNCTTVCNALKGLEAICR